MLSKWQFKKKVQRYIVSKQRTDLLESMKSLKKISYEQCATEEFRRKPYFYTMTISQIRDRFRFSSLMVETVRYNFSNKYRTDSLECQSCKAMTPGSEETPRDTQSHLLTTCPAFSDLRTEYDTQSDLGLVQFFKAVIERRVGNEED